MMTTLMMLCSKKFCQKHKSYGFNGNNTWSETGYKCLRRDKVKEHQDSDQHKHSLSLELNQTVNDMSNNITSSAQKAIVDALKVMYYLISKNLPLDHFNSMIELDATNLPNLRLAKNDTYPSWEIVHELLNLLSEQVSDTVTNNVKSSPCTCFSLMVDEVSDNLSIKHLALCSRYIDQTGQLQRAFLVDTELPNATAETVTNSIISEINKKELLISDMSGFASDGAAVFLGKKNGVAKKLKDHNPAMITNHCRDHRLALACRDSFNSVPLMKKQTKL
ncbi:Hypothetical predicted protein [Mytilus galloprovincialis]|uniref:DUF4371 domain-containing protein n=1 Tax=Mytilus galloprovincialis TaxID=29158 RepID=A0A8B6G471_MYTGA|nr:Hypothetical predicted protein [Mytilus galloprovincialis]